MFNRRCYWRSSERKCWRPIRSMPPHRQARRTCLECQAYTAPSTALALQLPEHGAAFPIRAAPHAQNCPRFLMQTDGSGTSDPARQRPQDPQAAPAAGTAQQRGSGGASHPVADSSRPAAGSGGAESDAAVELVRQADTSHPAAGTSAENAAAVEAVRQQAQAAQQRLCDEMAAALQQLQAEAQNLATQTKEAVRWQQRQQCIRC